jgi:hypothetical protein
MDAPSRRALVRNQVVPVIAGDPARKASTRGTGEGPI